METIMDKFARGKEIYQAFMQEPALAHVEKETQRKEAAIQYLLCTRTESERGPTGLYIPSELTHEVVQEIALCFSTRSEWAALHRASFRWAKKYGGGHEQFCGHMPPPNKRRMTDAELLAEAAKYATRSAFCEQDKGAYLVLQTRCKKDEKLQAQFDAVLPAKDLRVWSVEKIKQEILPQLTYWTDFRKFHNPAYKSAAKQGWLEELKQAFHNPQPRVIEDVLAEALKQAIQQAKVKADASFKKAQKARAARDEASNKLKVLMDEVKALEEKASLADKDAAQAASVLGHTEEALLIYLGDN